jgi:hypothetical protein
MKFNPLKDKRSMSENNAAIPCNIELNGWHKSWYGKSIYVWVTSISVSRRESVKRRVTFGTGVCVSMSTYSARDIIRLCLSFAVLRRAFSMFDSGKSGHIEKEKVRTILNTLGHTFDDLELEALLEEQDKEGMFACTQTCIRRR